MENRKNRRSNDGFEGEDRRASRLDGDTCDRIKASFADPDMRRRKAAEIRQIRRNAARKEKELLQALAW